ncbi:hypothetical protein [Tenacibaculum holothuriorum]|uniref:hypothetical protein n=1 Tax=Tenacibaculum holothuriorum TaxID=1635173 RepID=UPI001180B746|nr:hypothetical protein [Tenacibaculum holothuriorum]
MKQIKIVSLGLIIGLIASCTTAEIPVPDTVDPTPPGEAKVTYEKDVKDIIFNNCLTCHSTVNPRAGLILVNYNQVKNSAQNGNLIARMNDAANPMPPNGKLVQSSLTLIDKWKADGFLEN